MLRLDGVTQLWAKADVDLVKRCSHAESYLRGSFTGNERDFHLHSLLIVSFLQLAALEAR